MESKFKVGDKVTIIEDWLSEDDTSYDYPCNLTSNMLCHFHGVEDIIIEVVSMPYDFYKYRKYYEEPYFYRLQNNTFKWSSAMFSKQIKSPMSIF